MSSLSVPHRPVIPGQETYREKATRKLKENPWVPLGCLITTGALINAMIKMRRGESRSLNQWLRIRVAAQGLTVAALVLGAYSFGVKRAEGELGSQHDADTQKRAQEKVEKDRSEFEGRVREAELQHQFEEGFKTGGKGSAAATQTQTPVPPQVNPSEKSKKGWFGW